MSNIAIQELKDIIKAHDEYAEIRQKVEDKIKNVFSENNIKIIDTIFTRQGVEVSVYIDEWALHNIDNIRSSFECDEVLLEYRSDCAVFKFITHKDD